MSQIMAAPPAEPDLDDRDAQSESFVKWIPLVVPLFALLLTTLIYLIGAEVL
jgi:hypothetical protein